MMTDPLHFSANPRDADVPLALKDPARRRMILGSLAAGVGALMPSKLARAQALDKSALSIAYPVDVPTWDPNALSIPTIREISTSRFSTRPCAIHRS